MIAGAGFAMMAWHRAHEIVNGDGRDCMSFRPYERSQLPHELTCSAEYYRITDEAWAAWNNEMLWIVEASGIPVTVEL